VVPPSADASLWVTSWHGSRFVGDADPVGDAGADAVGVGETDGEGGADVAGAGGGSGVAVSDELAAGDGVVDAGTTAVADSFTCGVVSLLLLDDLHELMSKAGVMTTRMSALRRCISGVSDDVVPTAVETIEDETVGLHIGSRLRRPSGSQPAPDAGASVASFVNSAGS